MLESHQLRVYKERDDLEAKIVKLKEFLYGEASRNLPLEELKLLTDQLTLMNGYSSILSRRILRF